MNFSLLRIFTCLFFVALPFSVLPKYGIDGTMAEILVAIGSGGLALTLRRKQAKLAVRTVALSACGAFVGGALGFGSTSGNAWIDTIPFGVGAVLAIIAGRIFLVIDKNDRERLSAR